MKKIFFICLMFMAAVSCGASPSSNPFLTDWNTPYGIPDFGKIAQEHYVPAVEAGIAQQQAEIQAIVDCKDAPTFENVVEAYEASGAILDRVVGVLFNLSETDSTPSLQKIVEQVLPMLSEHSDNVFMNPSFFAKVAALHDKMESLGLNQEQKMVLKKLYRAFVKNGVSLDDASQARMREINKELSSLEYAFGNNLLAENNAFAEKFGVQKGGVISAVDLIRGIGRCAGLEVLPVDGVITGTFETDFDAKAKAAIRAFEEGHQFVYLHMEGPDECGHHRQVQEKVTCIEDIDKKVIGPVMEYLENCGEDYSVLLMPDHPTPLCLMTHVSDPVPFALLSSKYPVDNTGAVFTEYAARATGVMVPRACDLMEKLLG